MTDEQESIRNQLLDVTMREYGDENMKLMTKELREKIPKLGEIDEKGIKDPVVQCKFYTPFSSWTWYVMEFDGENTFFGYVDGIEAEFGYFTLSELEEIKRFGVGVERDLYFKPMLLSEVEKMVDERRGGFWNSPQKPTYCPRCGKLQKWER